MDSDSQSRAVRARQRRKGHEETDARVGWVAVSAVIVAVGLLLASLISHRIARSVPASNISRPYAGLAITNVPQLQTAPSIDLKEFRAREEAELNGYGWIDRTSGVARIPIPLAMDLVLQKGFPVREPGSIAKTGPSEQQLIEQSRVLTNQGKDAK